MAAGGGEERNRERVGEPRRAVCKRALVPDPLRSLDGAGDDDRVVSEAVQRLSGRSADRSSWDIGEVGPSTRPARSMGRPPRWELRRSRSARTAPGSSGRRGRRPGTSSGHRRGRSARRSRTAADPAPARDDAPLVRLRPKVEGVGDHRGDTRFGMIGRGLGGRLDARRRRHRSRRIQLRPSGRRGRCAWAWGRWPPIRSAVEDRRQQDGRAERRDGTGDDPGGRPPRRGPCAGSPAGRRSGARRTPGRTGRHRPHPRHSGAGKGAIGRRTVCHRSSGLLEPLERRAHRTTEVCGAAAILRACARGDNEHGHGPSTSSQSRSALGQRARANGARRPQAEPESSAAAALLADGPERATLQDVHVALRGSRWAAAAPDREGAVGREPEILRRLLPAAVPTPRRAEIECTLLFADIRGSTRLVRSMSATSSAG